MHFVNAKGILSTKNGMNLYRGCSHGCIYCDSRSKCYHMGLHSFHELLRLLICSRARKGSKVNNTQK